MVFGGIFGKRRRTRPLLPPEVEASAEKTRLERGKLAVAVVTLGQKNRQLEELWTRMLEERRSA